MTTMLAKKLSIKFIWLLVISLGTLAFMRIAIGRGETINALWFIIAALCIYAIAYRFYATWIALRVLVIDESRATPAEYMENGRDYIPTNKWVVFGHHFAAIAGPGPLVGPTLAAQFGYLPGTLWILFGSVLGGCVQDMVILFLSSRRGAKSLGQMAKDELGIIGGIAALIATFTIMIILIAVLGLVVVNAMKHSPWATSTVIATIPIAMIVGLYMRSFRPGRVLEASALGVCLLLFSVVAGGWLDHTIYRSWFDHDGLTLAFGVIIYGFAAAILPVWLVLAPRDYLSTYVKLGTIALLACAIIFLRPDIKMPALTSYIDGSGPVFAGTLFPFVFITIACGAVSGFHALIASGTTPKLLAKESDIQLIGYGAMLLESFVALIALIAATVLEPGIYFAINTPASNLTADILAMTPGTLEKMKQLAAEMGEFSLFARTGGAPSLAVGMASILGQAFGKGLLALWYHFAIMFEAIFILTTVDAGTRVGRFMLQDILGNIFPKMKQTSWMPSVIITSAIVVAAWGYFLYIGIIDPNGGVNILWPLFGISNQILAAIALCVATGILIKSGKLKYCWITILPLIWLTVITTTAAYEKIMSINPRIGFLAAAKELNESLLEGNLSIEKASIVSKLIINLNIDAAITLLFVLLLWLILFDMSRMCKGYLTGKFKCDIKESAYISSRLALH